MHVGIDASSWANERGFGRFTRGLVTALAARAGESGNRYTLLFDTAPEGPLPPGVEVVLAGAPALAEASSGGAARPGGHLWRMARAATRIRPDLFFYPAVYAWFPLLARIPSVVCYHDTIPERFPDLIFPSWRNWRLWQAKTFAARWQARRVMTVSDASAADLAAILKIPRGRIDVVTEGADPVFRPGADAAAIAAARTAAGVPEGARLLLYVGGFNRHKNVIRLIEAMPAVLAACPEAFLAIVGRTTGARFWDNVEELQAGAADPALKARVGFTGEIPDAALALLLNGAEALVFPSLWEGFGLPALEAMAAGTPVLASDRGSLPEVLGGAGLLFDPEDAGAIAGAILRLLGDSALAADLRARARVRAGEFGWDRAALQAEACFARTLGRV